MGGGLSRDIPEESGKLGSQWEWDDNLRQGIKGVVKRTQALILENITIHELKVMNLESWNEGDTAPS